MRVMRRSLPLALTIAVHLLLLACLYLARRDVPPAPAGRQREMLVLLQPRIRPALPEPAVQPHAPRAARARPSPRLPAAIVEAPAPPPEAAPAPPATPAVAGDLFERARRASGKIDRELRAGAPTRLSADSPGTRFERAMAAAWIDRSHTLVMDRYVSPDGVAITRLSNGSGAKCYMSGTVNFVPGILHDSARPREVSCPPAGSGWTRQ
jgi:hypothetical protein